MKNLDTIAEALFNKVRSRFTDIKLGDSEGAVTTDATQARFFDLNFKTESEELGRVNIKLDEDGITVIFNDGIVEGHEGQVKTSWFNFLKEMRNFARRHLLSFDPRNIAKSNLEKQDYQYLAQSNGEENMSESKLFGTSKTSYQDMGEAKIIVKHSSPVNYNNPAGRTQRIESIYIESASGERFRYEHRHLNGARAMAMHVAHGGNPYDTIGNHITGLSEELSKLRQFKNYTARNGAMAEAMGDITSQVIERIEQVKHEVASLQKSSYYEQFSESFAPAERRDVPEETMSKWVDALTVKTFNEELTSVFPFIYRLVAEKQEQGLSYEDLVTETDDTCTECNKTPCECDDEVTEHNHLADFESHLDELTAFDYDEPQEPAEEQPQSEEITTEVMEFISSMFDPMSGTFPRGEEGVKIACEKRFGPHAGKFASYVVEKLSGAVIGGAAGAALTRTPQGAMMGAELGSDMQDAISGESPADDQELAPAEGTDELLRIRQLSGM